MAVNAAPHTKLLLNMRCRNLKNMDSFSKSDPMCIISLCSSATGNCWREVGRTEQVKDCLNPDFVFTLSLDYYFEEQQNLKFTVYDVDVPEGPVSQQDFIGAAETTVGKIVGAHRGTIAMALKAPEGHEHGAIFVSAEEDRSAAGFVCLQLRGQGLDKKDFFGKSDPYLVFSRQTDAGEWVTLHKTEVIMKTLDPTWKQMELPLATFCNGDPNRPVKIECFDWDANGSHDFIGLCQTNLNQILQLGSGSLEFINTAKQEKHGKKYVNSGRLFVLRSAVLPPRPTFVDYLAGGLQMNFVVAVDFTASNGDPTLPTSLHYMNPYSPNEYIQAINAVGNIIQDYDVDRLFPAYGFGARFPDGRVSHEFSLTGDETNPLCAGIQGVIAAYQRSITAVELYGPTNFAPIISSLVRRATGAPPGQVYTVLLIITDGVISDMEQTKAAIVAASVLPISIIIVGVGHADFSEMEMLDGDDVRLSSQGRSAARDIVQFVPFRKFQGGLASTTLATEVLAEIPQQVLAYMNHRDVKPGARAGPPPFH